MKRICNKRAFALTELITVLVIMGIVLAIGGLNFNNWQRKAAIERQAWELLADFNAARSEAMFRKKPHAIIMNADARGYILRRYSSIDESRTSATPASGVVFAKNVTYQFQRGNGSSIADAIMQFDSTGFTATPADNNTIRVNPISSGAAFDCIVVSTSRSNIGQMTSGGTCVQN